MSKFGGTIFTNGRVPVAGMGFEKSNLTSLLKATGKINLVCPVCGIVFETYACWAARKKLSCCSKACADEAKRMPVDVSCVICGNIFSSTPAAASKRNNITCSKSCRSTRQRNLVLSGAILQNVDKYTRAEGNGKLSPEQANEIKTSTEKAKVLANKFGVSLSTISKIRCESRKLIA